MAKQDNRLIIRKFSCHKNLQDFFGEIIPLGMALLLLSFLVLEPGPNSPHWPLITVHAAER